MSDHQKAGGAALKKPRILFIDENSVVNFPGGIERVLCNFGSITKLVGLNSFEE